jgi:hypothetical protein
VKQRVYIHRAAGYVLIAGKPCIAVLLATNDKWCGLGGLEWEESPLYAVLGMR